MDNKRGERTHQGEVWSGILPKAREQNTKIVWNEINPTRKTIEGLKMQKRSLKKLEELEVDLKSCIIGFLDETSPQINANTQRL